MSHLPLPPTNNIQEFKDLLVTQNSNAKWIFAYGTPASHQKTKGLVAKVYHTQLTQQEPITVKIDSYIQDVEIEKVFDLVFNPDKRGEWNIPIKNSQLLKKLSNNTEITYEQFELPFPFNKRDFVKERYHYSEEDGPQAYQTLGIPSKIKQFRAMIIHSSSDQNLVKLKKGSKIVRADIVREYWYIRKDESILQNGLCSSVIFTLDLKMEIPKMLLDHLLKRQAGQTIDLLLDKYKQMYPKPKL